VRELENLVERGVILASQSGMVEVAHLFSNQPEAAQTGLDAHGHLASVQNDDLCARILDSGSPLEDIDALVLELAVARAHGNLSEAARLLGMTRPQLAYRLKQRQSRSTPESATDSRQETGQTTGA
jgi:transcriptional regulator with AAA-type ATPase domain